VGRIITLRGQSPAALTRTKLQVSTYRPTIQFQILDFRVVAAEPSATEGNDISGILTMAENSAIDPSNPDFSDQEQIAWSHYARFLDAGAPAPGVDKSPIITTDKILDDKWFNYDLWVNTEDAMANSAVNWFIKLAKFDTSDVAGSISSLRQYATSKP